MGKEIDINNEEEILKECDFDYFYESENCSRELCIFYNDIQHQNADFNCKQALIDLGRIAITLNKQAQRIAELEAQLKNEIVPKFKIGQEVWWVDTRVNSFNEQRYRIESYLIDSIVITNEQFRYYGDDGLWLGDNEVFATKEEAQAKLEELKGE